MLCDNLKVKSDETFEKTFEEAFDNFNVKKVVEFNDPVNKKTDKTALTNDVLKIFNNSKSIFKDMKETLDVELKPLIKEKQNIRKQSFFAHKNKAAKDEAKEK